MDDVRQAPSARASVGSKQGANRSTSHPKEPHTRIAVALIVASLLLLVGCSSTGGGSTSSGTAASPGASSQLCQRLANVNQVLKQASAIGTNTTVGEVKAYQQKLTDAINKLLELPGGGDAALSNLQAANDQLTSAIKDLPDSAPIGQASEQLQTFQSRAAKAQTAVTKLASTLHCPS
jgi:hypothetical protein